MEIKVKRVYGIKPQGEFRCFFDVVLDPGGYGIHVYGCKLKEGSRGQLWCTFPNYFYQHQGKKKWAPHIEIENASLRDEIALAARAVLQGG
jgi:hypothetical protein